MKCNYSIRLLMATLIFAMAFAVNLHTQNNAFELLHKKEYTKLDALVSANKLQIPPEEKTVIQAVLANVFSLPDLSNKIISSLNTRLTTLPDSLQFLLARTRYDNDVKLFHYADALASGSKLLKQFPHHFTLEELKEEREALIIWEALKNQPPQLVVKSADTRLHMKRDVASLWNIPVQCDSSSFNFIFDTGAGISVLTDSYAERLHITIPSNKTTMVKGGLTGIPTIARIGVAEQISIGNITIRNVAFLVFPDSALSFAGGAYKINGIIGFPVSKEFEELSISHDTLSVPQYVSQTAGARNMAVDQLLPVIYLKYGTDELPFTFDTGANGSLFSEVFYARYNATVTSGGAPGSREVTGSSGSKKMQIFTLPVELSCFLKKISLPHAEISREPLDNSQGKFYGNLGQDVIKQYDGMTISFKNSYITFF